MNSIDQELKSQFNLSRNKPVGKKMGSKLWFHKSYISHFIGEETFKNFTKHLDDDFNYNLIRFDTRTNEICFIQSPDFDDSHEPIMGDSITISLDSDFNFLKKTKKEQDDNPLIYHHKWMMVGDDYSGFNVQDSKERSLEWKELIGIDRDLSNRIGRQNFWDNLCKSLGLEHRLKKWADFFAQKKNTHEIIPECFSIYKDGSLHETVKETTSTKQKPAIITFIEKLVENNQIDPTGKFLDIGCGRFNDIPEGCITKLGGQYFGLDPYHKSKNDNINSIKSCANGQSDVIMISNVLNTIDYKNEKEIIENILEQAKNALSNDGLGFIQIYEGEKTTLEKKQEQEKGEKIKMTPIYTGNGNKGFQNRMKAKEYLEVIKKHFPNFILKGKTFIVSNNPSLDLENLISKKNNIEKPKI